MPWKIFSRALSTGFRKGCSFEDKNGQVRAEVRLKWWDEQAQRLPEAATNTGNARLPKVDLSDNIYRYRDEIPLFFGHYWMQGTPKALSPKLLAWITAVKVKMQAGGLPLGW